MSINPTNTNRPPRSRWLRPEGVGGGGEGGKDNLVEGDVCANPNLVKESLGGNRGIEKQLIIGGVLLVVSRVGLPNSQGKGVMDQLSLLGNEDGELEIADDRKCRRGIEEDGAQLSALIQAQQNKLMEVDEAHSTNDIMDVVHGFFRGCITCKA